MSTSKQTDRDSYSVSNNSDEDDAAYSDDGLDTVPTEVDQRETEIKQVQRLSKWETYGIRFWRTVVLVLLIIAGVLVSTGTYIFLRDAEQNDYRNRVSTEQQQQEV